MKYIKEINKVKERKYIETYPTKVCQLCFKLMAYLLKKGKRVNGNGNLVPIILAL